MRSAVLVLLAACLVSGSVHAQAPAAASAEPATVRFRVVVEAPRPYKKLLEEGLDLARWQLDQRVTMPLLERLAAEARKSAAEALAAEGYFSAKVLSRIETPPGAETVVRITVEPGERTLVRGIDLGFSGPVIYDAEGQERIKVVRDTWRLAPGVVFRQSDWQSAKDDALARLARGRYAAARIAESEARVEPEARTADLKLRLDSGPVFHAGPTVVSGLKRYPASVVENLNPTRVGAPYDATRLDLFQRRLLETGYFNAVLLTIEPDPAQAAAAPLLVNVIEAPSQRLDTGLAFRTDTGAGVTVDYTNSDIFDSAWRLHPRLDLNQKEQQANVTLATPPRPGGVWNTYTTRLQRRDLQGEITRELVAEYARNWGLESTPTQLALSWHLEEQKIAGASTENNNAVFLGYRRTFRTTDDLVLPRRGLIGTAEIGTSIPGLSTQEFVRLRGKVSWLIPFGLKNDLLVRGEAGAVLADAREGVVSSFLFRTGGDQSIRGYAYQSIGVPAGEATVGGRYLALASVEYTRWITETLGAAVFVDGGDAFDEADAVELAVGFGAGLRWRSPVGPLRADVAYGERSQKVRLHFSVGFSF